MQTSKKQTTKPPQPFSWVQKLVIVLALVMVTGMGYSAYYARGGAIFNLSLNTQPTLEDGLVAHWTFDGESVNSDIASAQGDFVYALTSAPVRTTTGSQTFTAPDFGGATPKAAILWLTRSADQDGSAKNHAVIAMGMTDGTRHRHISAASENGQGTTDTFRAMSSTLIRLLDEAVQNTYELVASFTSFTSNSITINVTTAPPAGYIMNVLLLGGADFQAYVNHVARSGSTGGSVVVTAPGFTPDALMFLSIDSTSYPANPSEFRFTHGLAVNTGVAISQVASCVEDNDGVATSLISGYLANDRIQCRVWNELFTDSTEVTATSSTGFTITNRDGNAAYHLAYMAMNFGGRKVSLAKLDSPTTASQQSVTGIGFKPGLAFLSFSNHTRYNTLETDGRGSGFGFSAFTDKGTQLSASVSMQDNVATSNTKSRTADRAVVLADHNGTLLHDITLNSMDASGWTWTPTTATTTSLKWFALAVQSSNSLSADIYDRSGNNHHGTTTANVVFSPGKIGQAMTFNGINEYMEVPDADAFSPGTTGQFAVSAWVQPATLIPGDGTAQHPVSKGQSSAYEWSVQIDSAGRASFILLQSGGATHCHAEGSAGAVATSTWVHLTGVYTGSDCLVYVNGTLADSGNSLTGSLTNGSAPVRLGRRADNARQFAGTLDDVRIYSRALSQDEITRLYQLGATSKINTTINTQPTLETGLVGHWTFDGADINDDEIRDKGPLGNHALFDTFHDRVMRPGVIGQAVAFDADNDFIYAPHNSSLDITGDIAISFWMKKNTPGGGAADLIAKGDDNYTYSDYGVYMNGSGYLSLYSDATTPAQVYSFNPIVNTDWNHVVAIRSGSTVSIYVNGVYDTDTPDTTMAGAFSTNTYPFRIGKGGDDQAGVTFDGAMDDVRLYNRALSEEEITRLYQLGATTKINTTLNTQPNLQQGLVGHWTFDGKDTQWQTASSVRDVSGQGNHGTALGGIASTSTVAGRMGQGLSFNGSTHHVSIGNLGNGVRSVAFWMKTSSTTQSIIDLNGSSYIHLSSGTATTTGFTSPSIYVDGALTSTLPNDNAWHHIAITTNTGINATAFTIGSRSGALYFSGFLDDVRVYNRALSNDEVKQLYRLGR